MADLYDIYIGWMVALDDNCILLWCYLVILELTY
jgi:hypothetical protein